MGIGDFQPHFSNTTFINDSSNANMTRGLTINQGAADDEAIALKSSDVAHGRTSVTETDTYFTLQKAAGVSGGVIMRALMEAAGSTVVMQLDIRGGVASTVKTTAARMLAEIQVVGINGDANANIAADGNVFGVTAQVGNVQVARFMVDEDGDIFVPTVVDVTGAGNAVPAAAFDGEDDAQIIRAFETVRNGEGFIKTEFDKYVRYNEDDLVRFGILGAPVNEGGMWNLTQHIRLLNGAIWQLHTRQLESDTQVELLKQKLALQTGEIDG